MLCMWYIFNLILRVTKYRADFVQLFTSLEYPQGGQIGIASVYRISLQRYLKTIQLQAIAQALIMLLILNLCPIKSLLQAEGNI